MVKVDKKKLWRITSCDESESSPDPKPHLWHIPNGNIHRVKNFPKFRHFGVP